MRYGIRSTAPFIASLFAGLLAVPALAANWNTLSNKNQARIEVDIASLHYPAGEKAGKARIWHREVYAKTQLPDSGAFSFSRLTMLTEFQCDKRLATPIQRIYATADGTELKTETLTGADAVPIKPDSTLESVFNQACRPRKPAAEPAPPPPPPAPTPEPPKKGMSSKKAKEEAPPPPPPPPPWSYKGNDGPDKWGSLSHEYAACALGQRQSPVDIRSTVIADLPTIKFAYLPVALSIIDDGHGIRVDTPNGGGIMVDGVSYELQYMRFHRPSEMKINGKAADMDVQLIHQSKTGKMAILSLMIETDKAKKAKEQELIRTLWNHLPLEQNKAVDRADVKVDPILLIPPKRSYYTYLGSLTTPPCTEGVLWLVLKAPVLATKEQIAGFSTIYKGNTRPVQAVNNRVIKESR